MAIPVVVEFIGTLSMPVVVTTAIVVASAVEATVGAALVTVVLWVKVTVVGPATVVDTVVDTPPFVVIGAVVVGPFVVAAPVVVGATVVGALVVGALVVGALVVGALVVGTLVVGLGGAVGGAVVTVVMTAMVGLTCGTVTSKGVLPSKSKGHPTSQSP